MSGKILVADDETNVRHLLRSALEARGFEVIEAANGAEAIRAVWDRHPDLVILDVMMPGMSGYDICEVLKENPESEAVPILMLTGRNGIDEHRTGKRLGADGYMTKPFDLPRLLERVDDLVRRGGGAQEIRR
jgi:DNA-binding response OmpR family regulator